MLTFTYGAHTLAAIIWVGGMFFAHMVLRPSLLAMPPDDRLAFWGRAFPRFFSWVWASVVVLFVTGYGVLYFGYEGLASAGLHVRLMEGLGLVMMVLYGWMYFKPYKAFMQALHDHDMETAAGEQDRIRGVIVVNLILGLVVSVLGATGTFWG